MVGDRQLEVLGHLALAQDGADRLADLAGATQRVLLPRHPGLDPAQVGLGQRQQFVALAPAFLGQQRVLAHHQPLARDNPDW